MTHNGLMISNIVTFKDGRRIPRLYEEYVDECYKGSMFNGVESFMFNEKYKRFLISVGLSYVKLEEMYEI